MKNINLLIELTNFRLTKNSKGNPELNIEIDKEHFNTVYDSIMGLTLPLDEIISNKITIEEYDTYNLFDE